jgi:hypothetical protein
MKLQKTLFGVLFLFLFSLSAQTLSGQGATYNTAIGLRLGYPLSASVKKFVKDDIAVEGYVGFRGFGGYSWVNIAAALQKHNPIAEVDGLQWYYGGGASVFFFNYKNSFIGDNSSTTSFGVQGYLGLDYKFADAPLNITLDWIPTVFLNGFGSGFSGGYGSLGVRYVLD